MFCFVFPDPPTTESSINIPGGLELFSQLYKAVIQINANYKTSSCLCVVAMLPNLSLISYNGSLTNNRELKKKSEGNADLPLLNVLNVQYRGSLKVDITKDRAETTIDLLSYI